MHAAANSVTSRCSTFDIKGCGACQRRSPYGWLGKRYAEKDGDIVDALTNQLLSGNGHPWCVVAAAEKNQGYEKDFDALRCRLVIGLQGLYQRYGHQDPDNQDRQRHD